MNDELRIERIVEGRIDSLDSKLMAGKITAEEYNSAYDAISQWADDQYNSLIASTMVVRLPR